MKYKILIIEDSKRTYEKISAKIDPTSFEFVGFLVEETTNFPDYITTLVSQPADIYIVDWQLVFPDRLYTPKEIFKELSKTNFDFLSKYWIFYSGPEGNQVAEFLRDYFPNKSYYDTPGKGNIEGGITKSDKDHFKDAIQDAVKFLDTKQVPQEIKGIELVEDKTTIRDFAGSCYDVDDMNILSSEGKTVFQINMTLFICMAYNGEYGVFLYFDHDDRRLRKLILRFNNSSTDVKKRLSASMIDDNRKGFIYNPIYFDSNKIIINTIATYVDTKLDNLKECYHIKNRYLADLKKQIKIFQEHGILCD